MSWKDTGATDAHGEPFPEAPDSTPTPAPMLAPPLEPLTEPEEPEPSPRDLFLPKKKSRPKVVEVEPTTPIRTLDDAREAGAFGAGLPFVKKQKPKPVEVELTHAALTAKQSLMAYLDHATDDLNKALEEAEDALRDLRLGVEASVPIGMEDAFLSWEKSGSEWGLRVVRPMREDGTGEFNHPLLKSARGFRIQAPHVLPALHAALLAERERIRGEVVSAADAARAFAASIKGKP